MKKLESQELEKASNEEEENIIREKWSEKNLSYSQAVKKRFKHSLSSEFFWNSLFRFLGYVMCDFRQNECVFFRNFLTVISKILLLSNSKDVKTLGLAFTFGLNNTVVLCKNMKHLDKRIDIVWSLQKYVFRVKNWRIKTTPNEFEKECKNAVVTKCDRKRQ